METQAQAGSAIFGRGMGALITSFFGLAWLTWGLSTFPRLSPAIWAALDGLAIVLVVFAVRALRQGKVLMKAQGISRADFWANRGKAFRIVTALELAGIVVVLVLANALHRPELIAAGVGIVVGLHFLPLGRIFDAPAYYWSGGVMAAWDALTVALKFRNPVPCATIATGAILWTTAIYALLRHRSVASTAKAIL